MPARPARQPDGTYAGQYSSAGTVYEANGTYAGTLSGTGVFHGNGTYAGSISGQMLFKADGSYAGTGSSCDNNELAAGLLLLLLK